jgi:hypothetical protein
MTNRQTRRVWQKRSQRSSVGGDGRPKVGTGIINNQNIKQLIKVYLVYPQSLPPELVGHSISDWDVSGVTNMRGLFENVSITESLNEWDVSHVEDMSYMFHGSNYNKPLDKWDVSSALTMEHMFANSRFNQPINNWDTSSVFTIANMFDSSNYNQPLNGWNVSNVHFMDGMFSGSVYNHPLYKWDVSNVESMTGMFSGSEFNEPINDWDVSSVIDMNHMFSSSKYNHPLNNWRVSRVEDMSFMFAKSKYNYPLDKWDVSRVKDMSFMFSGSKYNYPLNDWDVSNVTQMTSMFDGSKYNYPLDKWDVSKVTYMSYMFCSSQYNYPLDNWDISNVKSMKNMFEDSQFNHSLDAWKITSIASIDDVEDMFHDGNLTNVPSWYLQLSMVDYKTLTHDKVYDQFDRIMSQFDHNPKQIDSPQLFITDQMLHNVINPYVVHYETTASGAIYPIITILKGTMLFTGRTRSGTNLTESYYHLYKLHNNPTLQHYSAINFSNVLTYFFPFPYLSNIISEMHTTLDMVVLTKDIRLLCLISPSPLERGYKDAKNRGLYNDFEKNRPMVSTCSGRDYDLCINQQLIMELKLNGYIGIAYEDSVSSHLLFGTQLQTILAELPQSKSALFQACCFNNAIYKNHKKVSSFMEDVEAKRTFGIPEIVLIPYDIHSYPDPYEYVQVRDLFQNGLGVDHSHFIFRHENQVQGQNSIDVAKQMEQVLVSRYPMGTVIGKSLQAPPLLTVLLSEVDASHQDYIKYDTTYSYLDVSFMNSYTENPSSKCAFEMNIFYSWLVAMVNANMAGGKRIQSPKNQTRSLQRRLPKESVRVRTKKRVATKITKGVRVNTPTLFYTEVSGMPVVATMPRTND